MTTSIIAVWRGWDVLVDEENKAYAVRNHRTSASDHIWVESADGMLRYCTTPGSLTKVRDVVKKMGLAKSGDNIELDLYSVTAHSVES